MQMRAKHSTKYSAGAIMNRYTAAMSDMPNLKDLLAACGLLATAEELQGGSLFHLRRGSALVVAGTQGRGFVAIAPLFKELPKGRELEFCQRLLQLNSTMGGVVNFAIQPDGWVVLHSGRDLKGMDAEELAIVLGALGRYADELDDVLIAEFFAPPGSSREEPEEAQEAGNAEATTGPVQDA